MACTAAGHEGAWAVIDPSRQAGPDTTRERGLVLVAGPPLQTAGIGRIEVRLDRIVLGDVDLSPCAVDRRAVLEQVRVHQPYRRRGFGRVLVAAALTRAPGYAWSTTAVTDEQARAFWAAIAPPIEIGEPHWCSHMRIAAGETP